MVFVIYSKKITFFKRIIKQKPFCAFCFEFRSHFGFCGVYDKDHNFTDYDLRAEDIEIEILDEHLVLYEEAEEGKLDYSRQVVGQPEHEDPAAHDDPEDLRVLRDVFKLPAPRPEDSYVRFLRDLPYDQQAAEIDKFLLKMLDWTETTPAESLYLNLERYLSEELEPRIRRSETNKKIWK